MTSRLKLIIPCLIFAATFGSTLSFAQRVVTVGGTVTEIAFLLNAQDELVASDTSSIYPAAALKMPKIGYQRTLSSEGVLSVHPDTLIITPAAGPAKVLQQVSDAGVHLVTIDAPETEQGILDKITQVAKALNKEAQGNIAVTQVKQAFASIQTPNAWKSRAPRLLFILQMGGTPMIAGEGTAPDALFRMAGAINAAPELKGYKALTPEALIAANPDAIVVTRQGLEQAGQHSIWLTPGLNGTKAGKAKRLVSLDALLALGLGPRTPQAIKEIHKQLAGWTP